MSNSVSTKAHAKVNLFLRVFGKDESGYHGIETAFCLLELADEILIERQESGIAIDVNGPDLGKAQDNLAYRAAEMVLTSLANPFGVRIRIHKNIPVGGGLGGGSSDAAATLHAVNRLAGDRIPPHELLQMGARIGSDVPFLVSGAPLAMAWNRGERMFGITPLEDRPVLLLIPDFGINTAEAYRALDNSRDSSDRGSVVLDAGSFTAWSDVARLGGNDFEGIVFGKNAELKDLFFRLAATRPVLARMSGSGSTLFAVYRNERDAEDAANQLKGSAVTVLTRTRAVPADGPSD